MISVRQFAYEVLRMDSELVRSLAADIRPHYRVDLRPQHGKMRQIARPSPLLMAVLKRLNDAVLRCFPLPSCVHSRRDFSTYSNAAAHVSQAWLVNLDIADFFHSITEAQVRDIWIHRFGFGRDLAKMLTRLTTLDGAVPLGAPTSPALGNIVLVDADRQIQAACVRVGVTYTRWVDDLTLSGDHAPRMVGYIIHVLCTAGFQISRRKIRVSGPGRRHVVTGRVVNGPVPTAKAEYLNHVKAMITRLVRSQTEERSALLPRVMGSLGYLQETNPTFVHRQLMRLRQLEILE